jgi:hypothetical protein
MSKFPIPRCKLKSIAGEAGYGDDFKGISKDFARLRKDARFARKGRWGNNFNFRNQNK